MGMKQRNRLLGSEVYCCLEIGFVAITGRTGKAKILKNCLATNRAGDNVFKLKNCNCQSFRRATVGAAISKIGTNLSL